MSGAFGWIKIDNQTWTEAILNVFMCLTLSAVLRVEWSQMREHCFNLRSVPDIGDTTGNVHEIGYLLVILGEKPGCGSVFLRSIFGFALDCGKFLCLLVGIYKNPLARALPLSPPCTPLFCPHHTLQRPQQPSCPVGGFNAAGFEYSCFWCFVTPPPSLHI